MCWSAADPELTATWLSANATKAKQPCFSCGSPDHLAPHCLLKAQVAVPGLHCPVCNHVGHTTRDCSLLPQENVSNAASQPSVSQLTNDDNVCRVYNKHLHSLSGRPPAMYLPQAGTMMSAPNQLTYPYACRYLRDFLLPIQPKPLSLG